MDNRFSDPACACLQHYCTNKYTKDTTVETLCEPFSCLYSHPEKPTVQETSLCITNAISLF